MSGLRLCKTGRLFEVQNWISSGNKLSVPTDSKTTPLEVALNPGFHSLVEVLVSHETSQEPEESGSVAFCLTKASALH